MELILIGAIALLTSGVILLSGFGLGTILMPVFALFFPVPLAIARHSCGARRQQPLQISVVGQAGWLAGRGTFQRADRHAAMAGARLINLFEKCRL
jgi:hypothetical protein